MKTEAEGINNGKVGNHKPKAKKSSVGQKDAFSDEEIQAIIRKCQLIKRRQEKKAHTDYIKQVVNTLVLMDRVWKKAKGTALMDIPFNIARFFNENEEDLMCAMNYYKSDLLDGSKIPCLKDFVLCNVNEKAHIQFNFSELPKDDTAKA